MGEIAEAFDCAGRTLEARLEPLVVDGVLKTKPVGSQHQVWWRPASRVNTESTHDGTRSTSVNPQQLHRPPDELEPGGSDILDRIRDGVVGLDDQYRLVYVNDQTQALFGIDESTVHGDEMWDAIEITDRFKTSLRTAFTEQEPVLFEEYYEPLDVWFDTAMYPSETGLSIFFRDISERKQREQELRTGMEQFRIALRHSPVATFRLDTDLRYTWAGNTRHGFSEREILGKRDTELLPPDAAEIVMAPKRQVLETGESVRQELSFELPSGTVTYDMSVEPLYDAAAEICGLTATAVDLTESLRTKEALRSSEKRLRLALRTAEMGAWELDLRTEAAPVHTSQHDRIFGYEELDGDWTLERFLDHVHSDDRDLVEQRFEEAFETGSWTFECRIIRANGLERWISVDGDLQSDTDDEPVCIVGIVRDITDRKRRQQALKESEQRYRTLIENFPNGGVALLDDDLRHTVIDGRGFEMVGFDVDRLRGRRIHDVFPSDVVAILAPQYRATLDGEPQTFELQLGERICEFRTIPLTNADGVFSILSIFHDVTLRKETEQRQLTALNQIHETAQDITHLVIESSTRTEIEQVVCERFDAADSYLSAWIGQLDSSGQLLTPSAIGGEAAGGLGASIELGGDDLAIAGPIASAIETGESRLIHTSPTDPVYAQWWEPSSVDYRPGIAIPITYKAHVYGVLVVYTERTEPFERRERDTLERLGRVIGHAINSIERKRALIADRATEVTVRSDAIAEPFLEGTNGDTVRISIDRTLSLTGGRSLVYYTTEGIDPDHFIEVIETFADGGTVRLLETIGPTARLELSTDSETIHSVIATYGGRIREAVLQDGVFTLTIRIPEGTPVRQVLDAVRNIYPDLQLITQTTVTPTVQTAADAFLTVDEQLTDRQRETLEVGYYAGFFEWPRESSGDDLAELMDVTPATVHHHLRHGQRKLLSAFFDEADLSRD